MVSDFLKAAKASAAAPGGDAASPRDREWISDMIAHHQDAVDMSRDLLDHEDPPPPLRQLAQGIISGQSQEIARMQGWLSDWFGERPPPADDGM